MQLAVGRPFELDSIAFRIAQVDRHAVFLGAEAGNRAGIFAIRRDFARSGAVLA